jgi:hypothetical protein
VKSRNAWVFVLFGVIAVFVIWRLVSGRGDDKRASAPAPSAEPTLTQEPVNASPQPPPIAPPPPLPLPTAVASAEDSDSGRPHVDVDTVMPASAWVNPPAPSVSAKPYPTDVPEIANLSPERMKRSLAFYERRVQQLEPQLRTAESHGDAQEIERIKRQLDDAKRRVALLRAELGQ